MAGTEDDILASIASASGDSFTNDDAPEVDTTPLPPLAGAEQSQTPPTTTQPQTDTKPAAQQPPVPPQPNVKRNERGDIVDENGNVIATRGAERRLHEQAERARAVAEQRGTEVTRLQGELAQLRVLNDLPRQLGVTPEDTREAIQFAAKFNADPVSVIHELLARAVQRGYDLNTILGEAAQGSIQTDAIRRMIDERITPITQSHTDQMRTREVEQAADREMNEFLNENPHAAINQDRIAFVMSQMPQNLPPRIAAERALIKLERFAMQYGFDINEPLQPQIDAYRQQQAGATNAPPQTVPPNTPTPQPQRAPNAQRPVQQPPAFPQGRGAAAPNMQPRERVVSPNDSWMEIIRGVAEDLGGIE